jgi:hypothetical protein
MAAPSVKGHSQVSVIDLHTDLSGGVLHLDNYLVESTQELNAITEIVDLGEMVDHNSREWMLAQVDFIIETIGNEDLEIGDEMRSNLLQLLLAIANLNEQIRSLTPLEF